MDRLCAWAVPPILRQNDGMTPAQRLQTQWTHVNGRAVFARTGAQRDTAPQIICVHGVAVSSSYMAPLARQLARRFNVFAPDLPGYGRSSRPDGALDVPQLADDLAQWVRAAGAAPAVLVANSFGCQVAADLAARQPDLVTTLILIGPTLDPALRRFFHPMWREARSVWYDHPAIVPLVLHDVIDMNFGRALRMYYHCLRDRIEDKLPHVRAPALVLRGDHDQVADQAWCERVVELLPKASLKVIPHGGHVVHYTRPTETADMITRFIPSPAWSAC
jgi:2-hydroxy-6-oxonona-2,4-dienedioate hydrolase